MAGVIFILIWVFFGIISAVVNRTRANKQFTHEIPSALTPVLLYWLSLFLGIGLIAAVFQEVLPDSEFKGYAINAFLIAFFSPFLISKLLIFFGKVKASYRFAKLAYVFNGKSPFAGGLFAGFIASKKIQDPEKKQTELRWLRDQYLKISSKKKLFSGEIIAFVLIDSELTHPDNNDYLVKRLEIVRHLPAASIPKPIARYAIKRCLAKAFPSNNWQQVMQVLQNWGEVRTHFTNYINAFYQRKILEKKSFRQMPFFIRDLLAFRHKAIKQWCHSNLLIHQNTQTDINDRESAIKEIWHQDKTLKGFSESDKKAIYSSLTNDQQQLAWEARAQQLGVHNKDCWREISAKLDSLLEDDQLSEEQQKIIDDQHQALKYIKQSIRKKWETNVYRNSAEESVDWLQFLFTFNKLANNKNEQLTAFSAHSGLLWDAMAGFWNNPNEYRLAYMLASICDSYALECGLDDFQDTINFILSK